MRALLLYLILFLTGNSFGGESRTYIQYHYDKLGVTLFPSRKGHAGQFETVLKEAFKDTEGFFERDDVKIGAEILENALESLIGPVAKILPMIQDALGKPQDFKAEVSKVLSEEFDRREITKDIEAIKDKTNLFSQLIVTLNETLIENNRKEISPHDMSIKIELARNDASIIQVGLKELIQKFRNGDSLLWTHPQLAVQPLFALVTLISLFTPIRDTLYEHVRDESIISCQMLEILHDYRPSILYWRLRQIVDVPDQTIYDMTYNPDVYREKSNYRARVVQCEKTTETCFRDKIQDGKEYCGDNQCLIDYLVAVRSHVEEVFRKAQSEMGKTCSQAQQDRDQKPSGG